MSPRDDSDLEKLIEEAKLYDCVRFTWSDIHGIQRVAHMMPHNLESKIRNGTGVVHSKSMSTRQSSGGQLLVDWLISKHVVTATVKFRFCFSTYHGWAKM